VPADNQHWTGREPGNMLRCLVRSNRILARRFLMSAKDDQVGLPFPGRADDLLRRFAVADKNLIQQALSKVIDGKPAKSRAIPARLRFVWDFTIDRPVAAIHAKFDRLRNVQKQDFSTMRFG